ncbi:autoinducer binding domain-containing protein (plasmid) [Rhizobium sp. B230/85]|uniref:helix-turn-helix transcriptional regulator n=1 Tax=unclassified Rhizobium TaxID=2613769 RepID=UPI001ADA1D0B|nr:MULTISPECIES: autoinducer binding domain-containing protein [unclassified Rhizobium]MBO9136199.1 autoinducer binding domain-containing protein [Rhizobium sp. B209b/85]QXZ99889.1 autoinducer binding domain-containing protein [Rhizobium sp. B230/85]
MPVRQLAATTPKALDAFPDLRSVPRHRHFGRNPIIDRLRLAVTFDYIVISGLDLNNYRFGFGSSIDTDLPPAFFEAYEADRMFSLDPFIRAVRSAHSVIAESDVYARDKPPERLAYLARMYGVHNRTFFPVARNDVVYGAVYICRTTPFTDEEKCFLSLVAEVIHTAITKPLMDRFAADELRLLAGEIACLKQASFGLTSEAIAVETGYQLHTVNTYMNSVIKKLGVASGYRLT